MPSNIGSMIAAGRTADVYLWGKNEVVKLYKQGLSSEVMALESRVASAVSQAGLPVPAVGEIVRIGNRIGLVLERVKGRSMLETLHRKPWKLLSFAEQLAELHVKINSFVVPGLPLLSQRLKDKIRSASELPDSLRKRVLSLLDNMPNDNRLCHGDFHPGNIILTGKGPIIIDWLDCTQGNPAADVARTHLLARKAFLPKGMPSRRLFGVTRHWFAGSYIKKYFEKHTEEQVEFINWQIINSAARLAENIKEEKHIMLNFIEKKLKF
jgi:uncharacterized protein (TIGR02172 family)